MVRLHGRGLGFLRVVANKMLQPLSKKSLPVLQQCRCMAVVFGPKSNMPSLTIQQAREELKDLVVGARRQFDVEPEEFETFVKKNIPKSKEELPRRVMQDSLCETVIPIGSDGMIKQKYLNVHRGIRFGRILEDLDTFAVYISYTHNKNPITGEKSPVSIVTALVDRIELEDNRINPDKDVRMCGHVTWAGNTSLEITMQLDQKIAQTWKKLLEAKFVMVARNPLTKKSAFINPLVPESSQEKSVFQLGEENKLKRQDEAQKSLLKLPPDEKERQLAHDLFLKTIDPSTGTFRARIKPNNSVWMHDTLLKNVTVCHPEVGVLESLVVTYCPLLGGSTQKRNLYNKIFGGYLMRTAYELAWTNASLYSQTRPFAKTVDDVVFRRPVEIGALLFMSAQVVYTVGSELVIKVHAEVVDPVTKKHDTTNDFFFIFETNRQDLPEVIPQTYAESMLYLDGKRHHES